MIFKIVQNFQFLINDFYKIFSDFIIPELPSGQVLRFELLGPWDDPKFMGLNAIEIFTSNGSTPEITKVRLFF